jgi:hypothetical protein
MQMASTSRAADLLSPESRRTPRARWAAALSGVVALLAAAASLGGLLATRLYRDEALIRDAWIVNDAVTLLLVLPILLLAERRALAGSLRGRLVWLGALHYLVYNYCFYLLGATLNAFLLVYAAIVGLAGWSAGLVAADLDLRVVAAAFRAPPARRVAAWMLFVSVGLACTWTAQWLVALVRTTPPGRFDLTPEFIRVVAALDLTLMVGFLVPGAVWLWRGRPSGFVAAAALNVSGALYNVVLATGTVVQIRAGLAGAAPLLALWIGLCVGSLVAATAMLRACSVPVQDRMERAATHPAR